MLSRYCKLLVVSWLDEMLFEDAFRTLNKLQCIFFYLQGKFCLPLPLQNSESQRDFGTRHFDVVGEDLHPQALVSPVRPG